MTSVLLLAAKMDITNNTLAATSQSSTAESTLATLGATMPIYTSVFLYSPL